MPIAELAVIIQVGEQIGVWWTIAILVADSVLGAMLMRSQGRPRGGASTRRSQAGRPPAREVLDGVLVIFGGALLLTPGFITDIFGLVFLLPPTRAVVRACSCERFADRMIVGGARARRRRGRRPGGRGPGDVEGTAVDVDADGLPRGTA